MTGLSLRDIARPLGGEVVGHQVLCPGPGHNAKDRSLSIRLSATTPDGFVCHSFAGDDFPICRDFVRERLGLPTAVSRAGPKPRAAPARETRAEASAARREAFVRAQIAAIGWHPAVFFNEPQRPGRPRHPLHGQLLGCIVAIMTDPVTALRTGAISRTYIGPEGRKVSKAKSLGQGGGVVRISPDDEVTQGLFLAEGIESARAGMSIGLRPMWATGSTSIMAKFPVLSGIEALTIIADNDANGAGQRAADEVAARWAQAGRETRIIVWEGIGDINDALRAGGDEP